MNDKPTHQSGISAVFLNNKKDKVFVFFNKSRGCMSLPTGTIDPGEEPDVTLVREMQEELGVTITSFSKRCVLHHSALLQDGSDIHYTTHVYAVESFTGTIENMEPHAHDNLQYKSVYECEDGFDPVSLDVIKELQKECLYPPLQGKEVAWSRW
jgi:8-oxo-dGTP pyrophosphatase MutT (NUDIX family)